MSSALKLIERRSDFDTEGIEPSLEGDTAGPTLEMRSIWESAWRRMITSSDVLYSVDEAEAYMASMGDCDY